MGKLNPGASKCKYHGANLMRFLDGLLFLCINTWLLLSATDTIGAFLNFAALGFLSSIDNQGLHLARDGYLGNSLETVAGDVQMMDTLLLVLTVLATIVTWVMLILGIL